MYGVDLSVQIENLMPAVGLGVVLGICYDVIRLLRSCLFGGKAFMFVSDALFPIICALSSYLLYIAVNFGRIRSYLVIAEITGFFIYRYSLGLLVVKLIGKFSKPFKALKKKINGVKMSFKSKFQKKAVKNNKIFKNKFKNLLKHSNEVLYNNNK